MKGMVDMRSMKQSVKIGVIGLGRFGRLHLKVFSQIDGAEIAAVCDLDRELTKRIAGEYPASRDYASPEDLIRDDGLDVVDIVTDEATHGRLVILALQHGKHVFVEKPLALTSEEGRKIEELQASTGKLVMVGNISRFALPYILMKRSQNRGQLGELVHMRAKRQFSRSWFEHFGKRVHPVYESGIHDLDLFLWYAGARCTSVYTVERNISGYPYPDHFSALLTFENGLHASLESSWTIPGNGPHNMTDTLELDGTIDAEIELVGQRSMAKFSTLQSGLSIWTDERCYTPDYTLWPTEHEQVGGAIRAELTHFVECVRLHRPSDIVPLADSVHALEIAAAIVTSGKTGEPVRVGG
ncbi:Inositol 2-dehydrogenase [Chlamydia abortus]|nr:Inositol 2-dehydrogenase [Chlamydia abortus]